MKKIWRALTFNLSQALYPLISDLYQIFEDLASSKYVSAARIKEVSQNLYIVISAVMLFALGIKLISAIVNPDLLDDKKKGAKKTFFRSVAALFLIVLVPMGFNKMYEWQEQIVSDHVVEKLVLGMDVSDDSNRPGQILAAYAFYSFCQPNENVSAESISSYYNKTITEDIYYIDDLDDAITSKTDGQWDLNYHPILSPAVGFFMVYEMVVLCMDIALRGLKLALLQLITPIILCAYVLIGDDVLQKWVKEVLSTFALVFVKIALVSFMVFGLSLIPEFFNNNNLNNTAIDGNHPIKNFLKLGIIRTFLIIGLLQLIKQLPEILNKILGTNIQSRKGIRGRLGEMAGVGEMAQKAWDKIKSFGGLAAASIALGPGGLIAAGAAGGLINHGWKRGFGQNGTPWKDTRIGRDLRHLGAIGKGIGAGLTSKGGLFKSIQAGQKAFEETGINKDVNYINNLKGRIKKSHGIGEDGRLTAVTDIDSRTDLTQDEKNALKTQAARNEEARIAATRNQELTGRLRTVSSNVEETQNALRNKTIASAAKGKYDSLVSTLDSIVANTTDDAVSAEVSKIKSAMVTGRMSSQRAFNELSNILGADDGNVKKFKSDAEKFEKLLMNNYVDKNGNVVGTIGDQFKRTESGGFNISTLGEEMTAIETIYNSRKDDLDKAVEANKFNDAQKGVVDSLISNAEVTYKAISDTSATYFNGNSDKTKSESFGDGIMLADANSSESYDTTEDTNEQTNDHIVPASGESTQEIINRVNNVHDEPTNQEHNDRYQDLLSVFEPDYNNKDE